MFFCYFSSVLAFSFTGSVLPAVWRLHIAVVEMLPYELFTCCAILCNGSRRLLIPRKFMLVVMLNVLCSCFMFTSVSEQPFANNGWYLKVSCGFKPDITILGAGGFHRVRGRSQCAVGWCGFLRRGVGSSALLPHPV